MKFQRQMNSYSLKPKAVFSNDDPETHESNPLKLIAMCQTASRKTLFHYRQVTFHFVSGMGYYVDE